MRMACAVALLVALAATPAVAMKAEVQTSPGTSYPIRLTSLKEARFRNTIRQKYDFSCGSAAVATLLTYQYGYPIDEQAAFDVMFTNGDRAKIGKEGFSLLDIKRFLASRGFDADGFDVPLEKLDDEGIPAIVLINERGYHHFVVIKGYKNGRVLVGDPARGTRSMSKRRFDAMWNNHVVFVIHNERDRAIFNSPRDWAVAPAAPISEGIERNGLAPIVMPKRGPGDI
ncbi:peptidase C39 [Luteibacter rhizovicinus DSM 16549]|uniref:Peptidase C39 n=1 Tax=Luteibacter rhizovicinus DSM 16549 TaxID=1440763 RepID=A0A0G9HEY0_9GAMM|nr:C39 family peptidase [Luteibacter rhizovicinus]APG04605.1 peptidase C39 [Luteibacter rhizovicinus DSM 16549]KLD68350.1 peptidase C39 [Luteibacter rhizovicinus DSM 16549]KLD77586.1 peptidase C39 [Xanthomonas hyacinthi DSM 19077]